MPGCLLSTGGLAGGEAEGCQSEERKDCGGGQAQKWLHS